MLSVDEIGRFTHQNPNDRELSGLFSAVEVKTLALPRDFEVTSEPPSPPSTKIAAPLVISCIRTCALTAAETSWGQHRPVRPSGTINR